MAEQKTLDVLKKALLLEKRGQAFYRKISEETRIEPVGEFFSQMANEEERHVQILSDQFRNLESKGFFSADSFSEEEDSQISVSVLTESIKKRLASADFEAAAISAAMAMEQKAIDHYSQGAANSNDPEEKALYTWLADWERKHLAFLAKIDRDLTESIWQDQNFWPM